jgi:acyl-CoA reductase-like NAD-dependent aldehyde dehydrogenase
MNSGCLALHNAWSPILAAIFAGNAIVLKCSEHVVWSTDWFVNVIRQCLTACGYDDNLVQVRRLLDVNHAFSDISHLQLVCCYPEDAEALTKSPAIKHITFIGSETVGRKVHMFFLRKYLYLRLY